MNINIVKFYVDVLLEEKPNETPEDKIFRSLGANFVKEILRELIAHRESMIFSSEEYGNLTDDMKRLVLNAQLDAWGSIIKKTVIDECAKCEDFITCPPHKRLMSSLLMPQTGPLCDKFDKSFRATWDTLMSEITEIGMQH